MWINDAAQAVHSLPGVYMDLTDFVNRDWHMGGNRQWTGTLAELRVYEGALTDKQRAALFTSLRGKYNLPPLRPYCTGRYVNVDYGSAGFELVELDVLRASCRYLTSVSAGAGTSMASLYDGKLETQCTLSSTYVKLSLSVADARIDTVRLVWRAALGDAYFTGKVQAAVAGDIGLAVL